MSYIFKESYLLFSVRINIIFFYINIILFIYIVISKAIKIYINYILKATYKVVLR